MTSLYRTLLLIFKTNKCPNCKDDFNKVYRSYDRNKKPIYLCYCKECNITFKSEPISFKLTEIKKGMY